ASAIVFTTGYQANLAAISALAGRGDHLLIDADSHACIYDACRLSEAETIRFRHNSPEDLAKRLSRLPEDGARLVVVEGLYSMLGDVAPIAEFIEVAHAHGAMLYVDEAHSIGCYGDHGRGIAQAQGVLDKVDFISGTFSKSFASIGGFCVSRHPAFEMIRLVSRPYLFTASGSPANVAAARAALSVISSDAELGKTLWSRAQRLHAGLTAAGFIPASPPGPIIAIERPDELTAVREWNTLLNAGIYVNLAVPPATPQAKSLLRLSVSAAHSEAEIDQIIAAFRNLPKTTA
ncbi:MAG: aminotransferase class I/II-fold pyridoxal phosphate-dependent enzyme, partial [Paracoccaceae bacterium]|nr:aminotransferase class I/II-fold pyridoxal phosphate-dependent enzyme [Paracoccaceae bacterium]